jgi:hypothetical protein
LTGRLKTETGSFAFKRMTFGNYRNPVRSTDPSVNLSVVPCVFVSVLFVCPVCTSGPISSAPFFPMAKYSFDSQHRLTQTNHGLAPIPTRKCCHFHRLPSSAFDLFLLPSGLFSYRVELIIRSVAAQTLHDSSLSHSSHRFVVTLTFLRILTFSSVQAEPQCRSLNCFESEL